MDLAVREVVLALHTDKFAVRDVAGVANHSELYQTLDHGDGKGRTNGKFRFLAPEKISPPFGCKTNSFSAQPQKTKTQKQRKISILVSVVLTSYCGGQIQHVPVFSN